MIPKILLLAVPTTLLLVGVANAGETIHESSGALAQVVDKWNVSEPDKGHKLVEFAGRGVAIPDDPTAPMASIGCVGNYEYMPDGSWKGAGTCTDTYKGGDKTNYTWEEGSLLKEYTYKYTGGTGKFEGASGGGTYTYENLTDTLQGGRYKDKIELP